MKTLRIQADPTNPATALLLHEALAGSHRRGVCRGGPRCGVATPSCVAARHGVPGAGIDTVRDRHGPGPPLHGASSERPAQGTSTTLPSAWPSRTNRSASAASTSG